MKNILFFFKVFLLLILAGCASKPPVSSKISCPNILFSSEHSAYITSFEKPINQENISYKATINNYSFSEECEISNNIIKGKLSLLFIVIPEIIQNEDINIPFYIAFLNEFDELIEMQYFQATGKFDQDLKKESYQEKELIEKIIVKTPNYENSAENITIVIGFMLDKEKLQLLN